jgi:hypothetical protein
VSGLWPAVVAGAVLLVVVILFVVVVRPAMRRLGRQRSDVARLLAEGAAGTAVVLSARQTGGSVVTGGVETFEVAMQLQVEPQVGPAFRATATTFLSAPELTKTQAGAAAVVRFIPGDQSQVAITNLLGPLPDIVEAQGQDLQQACDLLLDSELVREEVRAQGVTAPARVQDSRPTGIVLYGGAVELIKLSLTIEPAGGPSFAAEAVAGIVVASLHKVRPGASLTVRYDPKRPNRVAVTTLSEQQEADIHPTSAGE